MANATSFVHLTDLHLGTPGVPDATLNADTTANFAAILADIARIAPPPAFVAVSGDLTNRGDETSYRHLLAMIAASGLEMPFIFALGNHDDRAMFYATVLGGSDTPTAPYDHALIIEGVHLIVLDTTLPGRVGGGFEPGQIDWLADRLAEHPELPKLLMMHHAPALDAGDDAAPWDSLTLSDTEALREALAGRNVVGILSGHIHFDRVSNWHGIPVVIGIGQHAATDALALPGGLRIVEGVSLVLGTLRPSGLTVSFAPQPSSRQQLQYIPQQQLQAFP